MYCLISTFSKTFDELGLIYFIPSFLDSEIKTGQIVEIPIWKQIEIWIVLKIWTLEKLNNSNISEKKIRSIISIKNENIFLDKNRIKLVQFIAKYYFSHIHNSISLFFPKNMRDKMCAVKQVPLGWKNKVNLDSKNNIKYSFNFDKKLSKKQNMIFEEFKNSKEKKFLLHWITGSWKTEIYIKLIKEELDKNKQSLLLIPEIILTNQLESRLKKVFWDTILVINSSITQANKTKAWIWIYQNQSKIIIGTRSALFYPYQDLWLIIIDEQHDNSYISNKSPRYDSIEIANKITDLYWNKLLLSSWTPSIKIMYNAIKGKYKILKLLEKFE